MKPVVRPTYAEFRALARRKNLIPLSVEMVADRLTPVALLTSRWNKSPYCFLLESVEGGEKLGRYSIVSFEPDGILEEQEGRSTFRTPQGKPFLQVNEPALDALARHMRCVKPAALSGLP